MARVKFELPPQLAFTTEVQVQFSQINVGNHLDNVQMLTFFTEGRVRFLRWLGYSERDVEGLSIPVGDLVVQYVTEGFYGETLLVHVHVGDFNKYGFDMIFQITEKTSGREIARGKTGMVFLNRETRKVTPVPEGFVQRLRQRGIIAEPS